MGDGNTPSLGHTKTDTQHIPSTSSSVPPPDGHLDTIPMAAHEASQPLSPPKHGKHGAALALSGAIKHYEIIRELGRGGMGAVYLARDTRLGRLVAIKLLAERSSHFAKRFIAEARATARCSHENIVVIHEVSVHQDRPYMVLQYLEGQTLRQWMKERTLAALHSDIPGSRPASVHSAVELMIPVVRALVCAHEQGLVHRDLKPENIMLTSSGTVKVLDFGIAKLLSDPEVTPAPSDQLTAATPLYATNPGAIVGTLPYMSPEQLTGRDVDHRSDIWAVGIMLYELTLGGHPLSPLTESKLSEIANLELPMPSASEQAPELGGLGTIIDRCLIKSKESRTASAADLLAELEGLMPARSSALVTSSGSSPFAGLSAFQESDAERFFGRENEIAGTVVQLRRQPLITLAGPSGAGKSSLVRAGVIPALKRSGEGWDVFITRPGRQPLAALAGVLEEAQVTRSSAGQRKGSATPVPMQGEERATPEGDRARLVEEPGYLGVKLRGRASQKRRRILVFVDQFEELYTLCAIPEERAAFVACLEGAADDATSPVRVILSIRADFLDRLAEDRALSEMSRGLLFIAPMSRDGLRQALIRPVEAAGHRFESPALIERMLDALEARRGALPLLQFTATKLWELRDRERRLLTEASYEAIGGVAGALASHADTVLAGLSAPKQSLARQIFQRLVTPERTRAIISMSELRELAPSGSDGPASANDIEHLVQHLSSMRLLVLESGNDGSGHTVELVHESLIDGWPTLARWLDEDHEDTAFLARLRGVAKEWETSGRADGLLWRGQPAAEARAFAGRYHGELTQRERAYLDAVISLASRTTRTKRLAMAGTISFLALLLAMSTVALVRIGAAEKSASARADELRQAYGKVEAALRSETAQKAAAEAARNEAETAKAAAEAEAERTRQALNEAQAARIAAQAAEAKAMDEKTKAAVAAAAAQRARDKAQAAEVKAMDEKTKADQAAKQAAESENEKQQIIDRAVGRILRRL